MKKKYYGVKYKDGKTEIFSDWNLCKKAIHGQKGVSYKGFLTRDAASAFINNSSNTNSITTRYAAYVDGSFKDDTYSYGFVLVDLKDDSEVYSGFGKGEDEKAAALRNVSGEMKAAMESISYAISFGIKELTICYDYSGIEKWATEEWKRNNDYTRMYNEYIKSKEDKIKLYFYKIKSHSGDKWNDKADELAKLGLNQ